MTDVVLRVGLLAAMAVAAKIGAIPSDAAAQVIACVQQSSQQVRIVSATEPCRQSETRLPWSIVGPSGPPGPLDLRDPRDPRDLKDLLGYRGLPVRRGLPVNRGLPGHRGLLGYRGLPVSQDHREFPGMRRSRR